VLTKKLIAEFVGGFCGVLLADIMYGLDPIQIAENQRGGLNIYFSEFIATFGLIMTIIGVKNFNTFAIAPAVGLYITAGYWFTSSTSFANPAVTLSRAFTDKLQE
jgi:glycerol uptake facilitator-like aquaporin